MQQFREEEVLLKLALKQVVETINLEYVNRYEEFFVGFEGSFGSHNVTPQTLNSDYIHKLVCVEGVVSRCDVVRSKLVKGVFFSSNYRTNNRRSFRSSTENEGGLGTSVRVVRVQGHTRNHNQGGVREYIARTSGTRSACLM